jgi:predicted nucleic acid-binding protein
VKPYADSSFIVALYLQQESSRRAVAFLERYGRSLPFTPWHRLEVRNAFRLSLFHGVIDALQCKTQLKQLERDLKDETVVAHVAIDWIDVLRAAEKLGAAHTAGVGCRSSDLFHVAAAKCAHCDTFLTFDEKQAALAKAAGLKLRA